MLTIKQVRKLKVYRRPKPGKEYTKDGMPRRGRKIGKLYQTVFDPTGMRVVGFVVRRPDLLLMFKRPEKFLALDSAEFDDDDVLYAKNGSDSWDDKAIKRLGIDYDSCLMWEGMDVKTQNGDELGRVSDISFDERTGKVKTFFLDDGGAARALIGSVEIGGDQVVGYKKGFLIVTNDVSSQQLSGGLAAKAGAATAKAKINAKEGTRKADEAASKAVEAGSVGIGKGIKRLKDSFEGARDEYNRTSGRDEEKARREAAERREKLEAKAAAAKKAASKKVAEARKAASGDAGDGAAKQAGAKTASKAAASKTTAKATATKAATKTTASKAPAGGKAAGGTAKRATTKSGSSAKTASTAAKTAPKATASTAKKATATAKATASKASTGAKKAAPKTAATKTAASPKRQESAGELVGEHLKGASTMFSDFKKEFDKASKGDD
ncbi:MAG: PRC-barrel domain-containing protein [Coriobacteriales bacterium]|jgi:uncharacterized protein YrrD